MQNKFEIGIDPGTKTGVAVVHNGELIAVETCGIIAAMDVIRDIVNIGADVTVHVENPNFRKYFGKSGSEKYQGAGSIKRDFAIWTEFVQSIGVELVPVPPASIGSQFDNVAVFQAATGWKGRTSKHGRDAVKMVYKYMKQS